MNQTTWTTQSRSCVSQDQFSFTQARKTMDSKPDCCASDLVSIPRQVYTLLENFILLNSSNQTKIMKKNFIAFCYFLQNGDGSRIDHTRGGGGEPMLAKLQKCKRMAHRHCHSTFMLIHDLYKITTSVRQRPF